MEVLIVNHSSIGLNQTDYEFISSKVERWCIFNLRNIAEVAKQT